MLPSDRRLKRVLLALVIGIAILVLSPLPITRAPAQSLQNQSTSSAPSVPAGMPPGSALNSTGYFLAKLIEQTPQFKFFANGTSFSIRQYQSFGYEWGADVPSEEIITFFSPNGLATIQAYVITAPAPGTTSVTPSQIAYIHQWPAMNSTSSVSLLMDTSLNLNGGSSTLLAPSFNPIIVSMLLGNMAGNQVYYG